MLRFLVKRLIHGAIVLICAITLVFAVLHLIPGDAVDVIAGESYVMTEKEKEILRERLGLKDPLYVQYFRYISKVFRGDLGESIKYRRSSTSVILERLPATLELTILALIFSVIIGVPLGIISATRQYTVSDYISSVVALLGISMPAFWLGIMLMMIFSLWLRILPVTGRTISLPEGIWVLISTGDSAAVLNSISHLILPVFTLGAAVVALNMRMMRSSMLDTLSQDFVKYAKSKGVSQKRIIRKHVFKNAFIPTFTLLALQFGYLIAGAFIIEMVFAWPGVGRLAILAIFARDYPLVQSIALVIAVIFIAVNIIVDIIYRYLDPRIRYD